MLCFCSERGEHVRACAYLLIGVVERKAQSINIRPNHLIEQIFLVVRDLQVLANVYLDCRCLAVNVQMNAIRFPLKPSVHFVLRASCFVFRVSCFVGVFRLANVVLPNFNDVGHDHTMEEERAVMARLYCMSGLHNLRVFAFCVFPRFSAFFSVVKRVRAHN
jgi:hypothetical protein